MTKEISIPGHIQRLVFSRNQLDFWIFTTEEETLNEMVRKIYKKEQLSNLKKDKILTNYVKQKTDSKMSKYKLLKHNMQMTKNGCLRRAQRLMPRCKASVCLIWEFLALKDRVAC